MNKVTNTILFSLILAFCLNVQARDSLPAILNLLLDEKRVQIFKDTFETSAGWQFEINVFEDVDDFAFANIEDEKLTVFAGQDCGSAYASADKVIDSPVTIDNIKWVVDIDEIYADNGGVSLNLNYGGINIFIPLDESTLPFEIYNGFNDLKLIIEYSNGVLHARANGQKLSPEDILVRLISDLPSLVSVSASADAADCFAGASIDINFIIASTVVED